jgi:hypothetical protein
MVGLLDTNDDGMTAAERSQPLWSGLIRAGLLGVAAGENIMPTERARLIAQAGGALGDIGTEQRQAQAAAAQNALRRQQVAEGKLKLQTRQKMQEYVKTPEFMEAMSKLDPARQQIIKMQIEAGDMDAVSRTIQSADLGEYRARQLELGQQRNDLLAQRDANQREKQLIDIDRQKRELELKQQAEERKAQAGPFGNTEKGRQWAIVNDAVKRYQAGDMSGIESSEYRAARDSLGKDTTMKDALGNISTVTGLDMSWTPEPRFNATGAAPQPKEVKYVEGQPQQPLPQPAMKAITENLVSVSKIDDALTEVKNNPDAAVGTKMSQITRLPLGAIPSDVLDALDPKGQKLRQLIAEISAVKVHDLSGAAVSAMEFPRLAPFIPRPTDDPEKIKSKLNSFKKALAMELRLQRGNIGKGSIVPKELEKYKAQTEPTYVGSDGKPVAWKDIEDTAKARGIRVEQVIEALNLTPGD